MRKEHSGWKLLLGVFLIALSALLYFIHYRIFHDLHHIFIYLVGDIAFVPMEVLMVTLVLHKILHDREKKSRLSKMNMVIGAFFSEVGTDLLRICCSISVNKEEYSKYFKTIDKWIKKYHKSVKKHIRSIKCDIAPQADVLEELRGILIERRQFLLKLLENPLLLEHESFTDLLWAVFHLTEELQHRVSLKGLPEKDSEHIAGDIKRVYKLLVIRWVEYMRHLKKDYPYLYSLAVRTNPFDPDAVIEVR